MKIGIIGPIASGKSTLGKLLKNEYSHPLIEEVVEENVFLPLFYNDKQTFGLFSQTSFYTSLFYNLLQYKDTPHYISDTTVYSNLVFSHLMYDEAILTKKELATLKLLAQKHLDTLGECDLYIVIKRTKEKLFENWLTRNRTIEKNQETYLDYHYSHYYDKLKEIFKTYNVNPKNIYYMNHIDLKNPREYQQLIQDLASYKEASL